MNNNLLIANQFIFDIEKLSKNDHLIKCIIETFKNNIKNYCLYSMFNIENNIIYFTFNYIKYSSYEYYIYLQNYVKNCQPKSIIDLHYWIT